MLQKRTALVVAGAAGSEATAEAALERTLHRFGFVPAPPVASIPELLAELQRQHYDLVVLPVDGADAAQLAAVERELRRNAATAVIATAPAADPELILRALRSGIHEFLVRPAADADLAGALDRLTRRPTDGGRGAVIAAYGAKGGVGVSTVATNVAQQYARTLPTRRVALADLVVGRGDVRVLLDLKADYDINDLAARQDRVDADVLFSLLTERRGLWVLPACERTDASETLHADATAAIIAQLRAHFAVTVLDCEDRLSEHTLAALDAADRIALVTQLTIPILHATQRTLQLFRRLGYADEKVVIVVNRYHAGDVVSLKEAETALGHAIACTLPNDYTACMRALNKGTTVIDDDARSDLGRSVVALCAELGTGIVAGLPPAAAPRRGARLFARAGR